MDEQRALLDQLMGLNRDGDRPQDEIKDFRDSRVCKNYLAGLCISDLFSNTKMDMGECPKAHVPELRAEYEKAQLTRDYGYKRDLERVLFRYHNEITRKIKEAQKRLKEDIESAPMMIDLENSTLVLELTAQIVDELEKAEKLGFEGQVDLSLEAMNRLDELSKKRASAQASALLGGGKEIALDGMGSTTTTSHMKSNMNQKLRVCTVCGAFLSIFDSDRRLADHFGGKMHLGYLQIQKKIEEINKEGKKRGRSRSNERRSNSHRNRRYR